MAEESDLEKTEDPSPRRLEQAREEGQVPQSRELSTFLVTVTGAAALLLMGNWMATRVAGLMRDGFAFDRAAAFEPALMLEVLQRMLSGALLTLMPLFLALMVAAVAAPIVLGGLVFAPKVLGFNFGRMNPIQGIGRMFSLHGLAEMVKAILKSLLVGGVAALVLWLNIDHLFDLMVEPLEVGMADFSDTVAFAALMIVLSLGLLALIDVPFQLWQYNKKLRMTKEEVKRESKEQEGDPMIKGRIRAMQREMARRHDGGELSYRIDASSFHHQRMGHCILDSEAAFLADIAHIELDPDRVIPPDFAAAPPSGVVDSDLASGFLSAMGLFLRGSRNHCEKPPQAHRSTGGAT